MDPVLTSSNAEFRGHVRPGDVLAFDSLGFLGGLVQLGDDTPVNHVSVVFDDLDLIEANRRHRGQSDDYAVRKVNIDDRLAREVVRSVTLLRHRNITSGADAASAVERIRAWSAVREKKGEFAYLATAALGPLAMDRSYPDGIGLPAIEPLLDIFGRLAEFLVHQDRCAISCSEFVYRCLTEGSGGELTIEIKNPLFSSAVPDAKLSRFIQAIRKAKADCGTPPSIADWVTPGDLLRSQSFMTVAVLRKTGPLPAPGQGLLDYEDIAEI